MNNATWRMLEEAFNRWPRSRAAPVGAEEFDNAMDGFGIPVDPDYREFVLRYGGGLVGADPIYGLRKAEMMGTVGGNATAPALTRAFREKRWPGVDDWLVFSIDQGGNPVGF